MSHKFFPGFPNILLLTMLALLVMTGCASAAGDNPTQPSASDPVATVAAATLQAIPSSTSEPTVLAAATLDCPISAAGTLLLNDEENGYCFLYPEGYGVVIPFEGEMCLVPGEPPYMACHSASLFINVQGAQGRTADQAADSLIAQGGFPSSGQRSSLTIAGESAVMLEPVHGQATSRVVFIVHADRLYTLNFIGPWEEKDNPQLEQSEQLYTQIINSMVFVPAPPWVLSPTPIAQQLVIPSEVPGTKFTAEAGGVYEFRILSGSYSVCASSAPYPACGKWAAEILVYVNRDISWTAQPNRWTLETDGINYFAPSDPDFSIGNPIYLDTAAEAEAGSTGSRITISLEKGDYAWLLPADGQGAHADNVGGMVLSIAMLLPLP